MTPLATGCTIGVLGGGQLGRLLALEAARLGFDVHIYCPEPASPAARVAAAETNGAYNDRSALERFAKACDIVTYEFENVPAETVSILEAAGTRVRPGVRSLDVSQDRVGEKAFLNEIGIPTVDYCAIENGDALAPALARFGGEAILKTRRDGYDGKGQVRLGGTRGAPVLEQARRLADTVPCVLEAFAPFACEVSVVIARSEAGVTSFEPSENVHENGILKRSLVPAGISDEQRAAAIAAGTKLANELDHIGVLALEFFVMEDGRLLANEFAPRVHNSGHWTPEACLTGQFEQHIRAIAGWPLAPVDCLFDLEMSNLMGRDIEQLPGGFSAGDKLVSYGKREARDGRKMAHMTRRLRQRP